MSLLPRLSTYDEDDESFNLRHTVASSARLRDGDVVFLTDLDWLGFERPETASVAVTTAVSAFTSVTRLIQLLAPDALGRATEFIYINIHLRSVVIFRKGE